MKAFENFGMIVLVCFLLVVGGTAFAVDGPSPPDDPITEEKPVPQDDREFFVDESTLPFAAVAGLPATQSWGIDHGAGYRIEVPDNWNGDLVMYTHGFRGEGLELTVDSPPLRLHYLANGFAWAASSYSTNNYDVRAGVHSTNSLARLFKQTVGEPDRIFITGFSMGGHVIGAAIEMFPNVKCPWGPGMEACEELVAELGELTGGIKYAGAAPACGAMGDEALFQYLGDVPLAGEALAGVASQFPPPEDHLTSILFPTLFALYDNPLALLDGNGSSAVLNTQGEKLRELTTILSGGPRPGATASFRFFQQLLFGFAGNDGTLNGVVSGNIYDNLVRNYQLDSDPALSADEVALNSMILRVHRDRDVNKTFAMELERVPLIRGRISVPVLSIHTVGDLFVPLSMEQIYARDVAQKGRSQYLVSRVTRSILHCEFTAEELIETFDDLVEWVDTGVRPGGDDILDPEQVADPQFGCAYSRGNTATRPLVGQCDSGDAAL